MPEQKDSLIERLKAESKDAIDFFLKLGELMERGEVEVKLIVKEKRKAEVQG